MAGEVLEVIAIIGHIIAVMLAIGAASITDYLHVIGLRKKQLEKRFASVYPYLSKFIFTALFFIYVTGIILVMFSPALLRSPLFLTKLGLVLIVTGNGLFLQHMVAPRLDLCVLKGTKYCTQGVLYSSAIGGGISIITWYAILVLALTKDIGYSIGQFLGVYALTLAAAVTIIVRIEQKAREWRD